MRVYLLTIGLVALIAVNLTSADDSEKNAKLALNYEDWAPTHYKAYDTRGYYQTPETVFGLLKELQKIYEPFTNEETNRRKEKVNKLIDVSTMDPRKCTRDYMDEFYSLLKFNSPYARTIVPYLTYHFINFLSMCEDETLHHNCPLIEEEYQTEIQELMRVIATTEIDGVSPGYQGIDSLKLFYGHIVRGILVYMENKSGIKLDEEFVSRQSGREKIKELFQEHVLKMCDVWVEATDAAYALEKYDVRLNLDNDELRWLAYGRLCRFVIQEKNKLTLKMSHQLDTTHKERKKENKESLFGFRKKFAKLSFVRRKSDDLN